MTENLFIQSLDEFNYTSSVNFFEEKYKPASVLCIPGFEIMFYNFDKIILSKLPKLTGILLSDDINLKSYIFEELQKESLNYSQKHLNQFDLNLQNMHIYKYMFSSLSREMQIKKSELYKPKYKDYIEIKEKLQNIDKKIITINGRNLMGDRSGRNNLMAELINFLLSNNYFVINCTLPKPNLNFNSNLYIEIDKEELCDYSKNISYFLNSDCLISVANSAGITNHICTKSNIILYGPGGWVDNPEFGYNNLDLYRTSKEIKPTFTLNNFQDIHNTLQNLEKPKNLSFFDESKLI